MTHPRVRRRRVAVVTTTMAIAAAVAPSLLPTPASAAPSPHGRVALPGSVASGIAHARPVGDVSGTQSRTVQLWLAPRTSAAQSSADAVSTPGSAQFHHYLSPAAYTARFAAAGSTSDAVAKWLRGQGFTHVITGKQRDYVQGTGSVSRLQSAFGVRMRRYRTRVPGGATQDITSNDRSVRLPAGIAKDVIGVSGLDSTKAGTLHSARPHAAAPVACSHYYGEHTKTGLPAYRGSTSFPTVLCGYSGTQLRAAYGMTSAATGKGQTVAYVEIGTPYKMAQTLAKWASTNGLPAPKSSNYSEYVVGSGAACGNEFDIEEQLDIESGYAMAPDQHQLLVSGDSCATDYEGVQPLFDADLAVVDGTGAAPLATIASNSWGLTGGEAMPAAYSNILHAIMVRAANEGVGMYFSSGDNPGISVPADDPYTIAVGGTSLGLDKNNGRIFETGWSNEMLELNSKRTGYVSDGIGRSAAGGGTSLLWKEPAYQKHVVPASMTSPGDGDVKGLRAVPDISADADAFTGILQGDLVHTKKGDRYETFADGGTSLASPLVAGIVAAAQQGQAKSFGFTDPVLYKMAGTAALHDTLPVTGSTPADQIAEFCPESNDLCGVDSLQTFDSQLREYTDQVTAKGYDTMSGVGTPNGSAFIAALRSHR